MKPVSDLWLLLGIALLAIIVCCLLYTWIFRPRKHSVKTYSNKTRKSIDASISFRENQKALEAKIQIAEFCSKLPIIGLSSRDKEEIQRLILAVDKRTKSGRLLLPEEIYCRQLLLAFCILLVCLALMFISPFFLAGLLFIPMCMQLPISSLERERASFATSLADEFLSFYKLYYVQFIQPDNTTTLSYVINSYLPSASYEVKKILKVVDDDLSKGEEFALRRWDQRFPDSPKVHKFVSVARARMKGDETSFEAMNTFLQLLQEEHDVYFNRECTKREHKIQSVINTYLVIGLVIVCCVAFAMLLLPAIKGGSYG